MRTPAALLVLAVLLAPPARAGEEPDAEELARALGRVRALEGEIERLVAKVAPSVGAVVNYRTVLDANSGRVVMRPQSLGSGVVVSRDGFLLTNFHVVRGAGYLTVTLPDGVSYRADRYADTGEGAVKGDIALLRLRGRDKFPFVDWKTGQPGRLAPGSFVFALGNPHGHALDGQPVVTMGILSGKGRAASDRGYLYVGVLQTDAEINPGNSGGPLFDAKGNLIGINGLIQTRGGRTNSGVGFAIPIDQVRLFMRKLLRSEGDSVGYGFDGLTVDTAGGEVGARVRRVLPGSPAAEAGLRLNDVITHVNGKRISNRADYLSKVANLPEKTFVRVVYMRRRKRRTAAYRLISFEDYRKRTDAAPAERRRLEFHERGYVGAHWKTERGALVVTRVLEGTGAERAGLKREDVLVAAAGQQVADGPALVKALETYAPGETVSVVVRRGGRTLELPIELCDPRQAAELGE